MKDQRGESLEHCKRRITNLEPPPTLRLMPKRYLYIAMTLPISVILGGVAYVAFKYGQAFAGLVAAGFACLWVYCWVPMLWRRSSYLELSREGLTERWLFQKYFVPWSRVAGCVVSKDPEVHAVVLKFRSQFEPMLGSPVDDGSLSAGRQLCSNYGLAPAQLAAVINQWRERYSESTCAACGYDLTGNVTGICSECGAVV